MYNWDRGPCIQDTVSEWDSIPSFYRKAEVIAVTTRVTNVLMGSMSTSTTMHAVSKTKLGPLLEKRTFFFFCPFYFLACV